MSKLLKMKVFMDDCKDRRYDGILERIVVQGDHITISDPDMWGYSERLLRSRLKRAGHAKQFSKATEQRSRT